MNVSPFKLNAVFLICIISSFSIYSQVGINTTSPNSTLDIVASNSSAPSSKDGILIPRVDSFPSTDPDEDQDGMLIFLNNASGTSSRGFYYWNDPTDSWIGIGQGEWKDGTNVDGNGIIYANQSKLDGNDFVITDTGTNGANLGIGTTNPIERIEIKGNGDNDIQLTSASTNPPNYIVYNTGGSIESPTVLTGGSEIGALVAKSYDGTNIRETGGIRFYADQTSSGGLLPTRFAVSLGDATSTSGSDQIERLTIKPDGNIGVTEPNPTARLHIQSGTNNPGTAPIKLESGSLLSTPENGAIEYDGTNLYFTNSTGTRQQLGTSGSGISSVTGNVNFGTIAANSSVDVSVTVTGIDPNTMSCNCTPKYYVPPNIIWSCYVGSTNLVRVRAANISSSTIYGVNMTMTITPILEN